MTVNSTSVPIDGHRVADYTVSDGGQRSLVDFHTIPPESVERIEISKDGANRSWPGDWAKTGR